MYVCGATGAFYMFTVDQLMSTGSFQSGRVSYVLDVDNTEHVDIDTPADFVRADLLLKNHSEKHNLIELVPLCNTDKCSDEVTGQGERVC